MTHETRNGWKDRRVIGHRVEEEKDKYALTSTTKPPAAKRAKTTTTSQETSFNNNSQQDVERLFDAFYRLLL